MTEELKPIPMRLFCDKCGVLHIDEGEFATKPHHTHACQFCGNVWRPAIVATVGVKFLPGFKNEPASPSPELTQLVKAARWFEKNAEGIKADVSSAHSNSRQGASEWMVEDDREFRKELRDNFEALTAALASFKEVE